MKRTAVALAGLALSGTLAACGEDDRPTSPVSDTGSAQPRPTATSAEPTAPAPTDDAEPSPTGSPTAAAPASPTAAPSSGAPAAAPPFEADTSADEQSASGGPLSVVAVRVAPQSGYDRVVFELGGRTAGQPGWRVEYVEDPSRDGSGEPVELEGDALQVVISGVGYPMDTGVDEVSGDPALPGGLGRVRDVELGGVFEGQYQAFVGVSQRAPFRVFRLEDPARVVLDIRTG